MDEKDDEWDEYTDGALFAINTNKSNTTKCSPFFLMYGRHPRLPLEVEKFVDKVVDEREIEELVKDLTAEDVLQEHVEKMSETRDVLFPKVLQNIEAAQEKQKQQYLRRKGKFDCIFKNGDTVLRRNMLQKTKKGHKMEDQWIGPYTVEELDSKKGTCRLRGKNGELLRRKINVKDLKMYRVQSTPQHPATPLQQPATASQHSAQSLQSAKYQKPAMAAQHCEPSLQRAPSQQPATSSQQQTPPKQTTIPQQPVHSKQSTPSQQPTPQKHRTTHQQPVPPKQSIPNQQPTPQKQRTTPQQPVPPKQSIPNQQPTPQKQRTTLQQPEPYKQSIPNQQPTPQNHRTIHQQPVPPKQSIPNQQPTPQKQRTTPQQPEPYKQSTPNQQPTPQKQRTTPQQPVPPKQSIPNQQPTPQKQRTTPQQPEPYKQSTPNQQPTPQKQTTVPQQLVPSKQSTLSQQPTPQKQRTTPQQPVPSKLSTPDQPPATPEPTTSAEKQGPPQQPAEPQLFEACAKIQAITEEDIASCFNGIIKSHLAEILRGSKESWRHKVFNGGISSEGEESIIGRKDLKFNVTFGDFEESQTYFVVNLIGKHFPNVTQKYLMEVLLPEALICLCCHELQITYNQADNLLRTGGKQEVGEYLEKLWQKRKGEGSYTRKRRMPKAETEVKFVKRSKMDQQSVLKMQRPHFKLDMDDVDIRNSAMLTDKHIQMAQELLHHQFPKIEGLLTDNIFLLILSKILY
ncbi:uncharacterized protein [Montipora foliosa]|uniref:uncharacterized protein n=1 Tax=Montipora foliosa TaxID=591990 RepID=UPI0035F15FF3